MRPIVENGTGMKKSRSQGNFHNGITAPVSLPYEPMPAPMPAYNGMLTMPARRPQSPWTSGTARTPSSFGGDLPESGYQFVTRRESAFDLQNVWDGRWGPMPQNSNGVNEPVLAPVSFFGGQVSNYAESVASTDAYIHNFPELSSVPRGGQTSLPNSHVRRDFDYSLKKLMSPAVFEDLLQDHMGRFRFKVGNMLCFRHLGVRAHPLPHFPTTPSAMARVQRRQTVGRDARPGQRFASSQCAP